MSRLCKINHIEDLPYVIEFGSAPLVTLAGLLDSELSLSACEYSEMVYHLGLQILDKATELNEALKRLEDSRHIQ